MASRRQASRPLACITVTLTKDVGTLASITAGRQVFTGSDGGYLFANVATGAYLVAVLPSDSLPIVPGPVSVVVPEDSDVTVTPNRGGVGTDAAVFAGHHALSC